MSLTEAIEALPKDIRAVVVLRFVAGQSREEICLALNISHGLYRYLLQEALIRIRETAAQ